MPSENIRINLDSAHSRLLFDLARAKVNEMAEIMAAIERLGIVELHEHCSRELFEALGVSPEPSNAKAKQP